METETIEYKDLKINIEQDDLPQSPNDWDDEELFLVAFHRQFSVERQGFSKQDVADIFSKEPESDNYKEITEKYHVFPLVAYIHSGVSLALANEGKFVDINFDTSQLGAVFVSKAMEASCDAARDAARELVNTWNQYLEGDVWGYVVKDKDGNDLSSCWGYYGKDEAIAAAKESANDDAEKIKENPPMYRDEARAILEGLRDAVAFASDPSKQLQALEIAIKNL